MHTLAYFSVVSSRICRKGHNYIIYMRVTGVTGVIVVFLLAFRNRYTMYEIKDSDSDYSTILDDYSILDDYM